MSDGNGELPDGWVEVPIGDLCDLINGRAFKPEEWTAAGLPIIRIQNLNNSDAKYNHFDGDYSDKHLVRPGELLFAWSGTPGTSFGAHVWQGGEALLNQHIFRVLIREEHLHKTYFQFAINHKLEELIGKAHGGVGLRHVTKGKFEATEVPLPPLAEQRRIVLKIESLQERSSRARRALSEVGPLLEQFRQSVLRAAFSGRMTADWRAAHRDVEPATELLTRIRTERRHRWEQSELARYEAKGKQPPKNWQDKYTEPRAVETAKLHKLPDSWTWASIEELLKDDGSLSYGILKPGEPDPDGVPMLRVMDIGDWGFNDTDVMHVAPELAEQYRRTRLETGDVVLAVMATIGRTAVVPAKYDGANVNRALAVLKLTANVAPEFVVSVIRSPFFQDRFTAEKVGTAQARINLSDLREFAVPLPPPEEATEIVARLKTQIDSILGIEAGIAESESSLTQLDQSILAKAFRGELVPQDPRDEPASILLSRIRANRQTDQKSEKQNRKAQGKSMKPSLSDQLEEWINKSDRETFDFGAVRAGVAGAYEELKSCLFAMLDDKESGVEQFFDEEESRLLFRRSGK